jgi:DNA polymerase III subunit epsilon
MPAGIPKLVVLDFETTNSPEGLRAVEIAAVLVEHGIVQGEFGGLIRPGCPIDPFSRGIHGISDKDVADAPTFAELWEALSPVFANAVLMAHNAPFDSGVLRNEIRINVLKPPPVEWWCTLRLSRRLWPRMFPSYSLSKLAESLELQNRVIHRARDDAWTALELFGRLVEDAATRDIGIFPRLREMAVIRSRKCWPWKSKVKFPDLSEDK